MPKCRKLILKNYNFHFILLMFLFRAPSLHGKLHLQDLWICAVAWWCQKHCFTHTHPHTNHTFSTLQLQLFSSHHLLITRNTVMNGERHTFVEFSSSIPTCIIVSSVFFVMGNRKFLHGISLLCQGKSN
jgi:hypothetical protein